MIDIIYYALQSLAALIIFATVWALLPLDNWWVRIFVFPRIQFIFMGLVALVGLLLFIDYFGVLQWLLVIALLVALCFQLYMVLPYTKVWRKEVEQATPNPNATQLKLMVSNVLTTNNNTAALINLVKQRKPDVLITLESDEKWQRALDILDPDYPYSVKVPLDNLYGMHLYSKLELIDPEVKYLLISDIPSIHTQLKLSNGKVVWLYCMHPMPPSPTEADKSTTRDAELLMVGRHIKQHKRSTILAGDLNDVAWSKTTRMFQHVSELLDPRIGRYFVNTFHAKYPIVRWALDHIFHSPDFTLVDIERMPYIGSDHFPVLTTLQYEPQSEDKQSKRAPEATVKEVQDSKIKIDEGKKEGEKLSYEHQQQNKD